MSLLIKFLPHALTCCLFPPIDQDQAETRPSTSYDPPSTAATVARKPAPYAMINVPDQPDAMDEHAFRRMLTASPACPIEAGPVSNAQLQRERESKKRKKQIPRRRGSLDLNYSFNPGSPLPTSGPVEPRNAKQKTSKPRLDKSSKGKGRATDAQRPIEHDKDVAVGTETTKLAVSARSAGLGDTLTPRNASFRGYDSDAEVIKTPEFRDIAATIEATSQQGQKSEKDAGLLPHDSMSNRLPSPLPVGTSTDASPKRLTKSSPYPCTPEKISFTDALQPHPSESPGVVLKRLSAGIANGSIRPPTDLELRTLKVPISHASADDWKLSLQAPLRWSSLKKEPDTPVTVIRRLSDTVQPEEEVELKENTSESRSDSKRASLLTQLEPALLEYLSRFAEMKPLDLTLYNDSATPKLAVKEEDCSTSETPAGSRHATSSDTKSQDRSSIEVTSPTSAITSEHNSVHLFNMDIPTRLESRSNTTILSPAVSRNESKRSLNSPPPLPCVSRNSPIRHEAPFRSGRAEHNRKPSDPQTRQIFEQPGRRYHPYWKASATSVNKSKLPQERDDASSIYSTDCGAPPSTSEISYIASPLNVRKNVNSLAIGGRSASTEIPIRRSSRTHSCNLSVPERNFSTSEKRHNDQLNAAAEVIGRYYDGETHAVIGNDVVPSSSKNTVQETNAADGSSGIKDPGSSTKSMNDTKAHHLSTGWGSSAKQSNWSRGSMDQDFSTDFTKNFTVVRDADAPVLKESATDLWNRVYREARAQGNVGDFLSHNSFDTDGFRRGPFGTSPRLRHRSSSILQTPTSALRRSQSVDPIGGRALRGGENDTSNSTGLLAKTMRRLSFWQLKPQQQQEVPDYLSQNLSKRSDAEVKKRKSFTAFERDRAMDLPAAHTPPLSHYLGYWGSFPSHTRAERNGPAGEPDNVLTRNFGTEHAGDNSNENDPAPLRSRISTGTLSLMQNTTKKLFHSRSNELDRTKTRSNNTSLASPNNRVEKKQAFLPKRWKRQYRTKSTEWRGRVTAKGHRSSISPGRPVKHPEFESLPNEGLFGRSQERSPDDIDGASFQSVPCFASDSNNTDQTTKMTDAATQTVDQQKINASSVWESVIFTDVNEADQRMENTTPVRISSEGVCGTSKMVSDEMAATFPRSSKDLKMPGGFEEY